MKFLWFALFMAIGIVGTALCYHAGIQVGFMLMAGITLTMIGYCMGAAIAVVSFMQAIEAQDFDE